MVLKESIAYHPFAPGFIPGGAWEVGQGYLRAISNPNDGPHTEVAQDKLLKPDVIAEISTAD
jgi:hypothetical protein